MSKQRPRGWYDDALIARAAQGPVTAKEVAAIMDINEACAISNLRQRKGFKVEIVGRKQEQGRACLYRITKTPLSGKQAHKP